MPRQFRKYDPPKDAARRRYSIDRITALRDRIYTRMQPFANDECRGDAFEELVTCVAQELPASVPRDILEQSLWGLAGVPLPPRAIFAAAWRLAGNTHRLSRGHVVHPWTHQPYAEWVPAQITRASPGRFNLRQGYRLAFTVFAGAAAGMTVLRFWSTRYCGFIARELGFDRRRQDPFSGRLPTRRFQHPRQLVSLRASILIDPALCEDGPMFEALEVKGKMLEWNRWILDKRDRIKPGYRCPQGYPRTFSCVACPVGYLRCPAGTHKYDYDIGYCPECEQGQRTFDPELSEDMCLACVTRRSQAIPT